MKKKSIFPQYKATIILILKDGTILHGKGTVEATKTIHNEAILTATLVKEIPKK